MKAKTHSAEELVTPGAILRTRLAQVCATVAASTASRLAAGVAHRIFVSSMLDISTISQFIPVAPSGSIAQYATFTLSQAKAHSSQFGDAGSVLRSIERQVYNGQIDEVKTTRSVRRITLGANIVERIQKLHLQFARSEWIFQSGAGTPVNPGNALKRYVQPTNLRRAWCTSQSCPTSWDTAKCI